MLRQPKDTGRVQARMITIPPGTPTGAHLHNGPVVGSIVTGSVVYQIDGEPEQILRPGDLFYEPADVRILRFDARADDVTFLAYFLLGSDQEPALTFVDP